MSESVSSVEKMAADSTGKISETNSENSVNTPSNESIKQDDNPSSESNFKNSNAPKSDEGEKFESDVIQNETAGSVVLSVQNSDLAPLEDHVRNSDLVQLDDQVQNSDIALLHDQVRNSDVTQLNEQVRNSDFTQLNEEVRNSEVTRLDDQVEPKNASVAALDMDVDPNEIRPSDSKESGDIMIPKSETKKPSYVYNFRIGHFIPTHADLITDNFEGPCKFGLIFPSGQDVKAPSIQVSNVMNRIYLRINTTIAIKFALDPTRAPTTDLFIRATPRYSTLDSVQYPVERCQVHFLEDDPTQRSHEFEQLCKCTYYNLAGHVIRSPTPGAIYCYDPISRRHSVLSPLKSRSHDIVYSFHCKSSCPKGIGRRPLTIVFTLEQLNGLVLGQTSLNVKICSCPKRDRDRSENMFRLNASKKHKLTVQANEVIDSDSDKSPGHVQDTPASLISATVGKMKSDLDAISYHLQTADKLFNSIAEVVKTLESKINK